jgi:murein DD-endopeptidase MepM/ murein hydrolase activator NlpD
MDARFRQEAPTDLLVAVRPSELDVPAPRVRSRRRRSPRRPGLLLGALLVGGIAAAGMSLTAPAASAGSTTVYEAQQALQATEQGTEVMPMASITVAEATTRLHQVAASRAARAEKAAEAARPKFVLPIHGARISSCFCARWGTFHYGIDFAAPMYTPEYSVADGVVLRAGPASGFGLAVYILHENGDVTVYGHMDSILVKPGQYVTAGQEIALLGMRGESTGPHLHFQVNQGGEYGTPIDPLAWLRARGVQV